MISLLFQKNERNVRLREGLKLDFPSKIHEEAQCRPGGQSSSTCFLEDDSSSSLELNRGATSSLSPKETASLSPNGKTRASRGSATDPQSLYARVSTLKKDYIFVQFWNVFHDRSFISKNNKVTDHCFHLIEKKRTDK